MTLNEAKKAALDKRALLIKRLSELAEDLNGAWSPKWGLDSDDKYYINNTAGQLEVFVRQRSAPAGAILFKNKKDAEEMLAKYEDEFEFISGDIMSKLVSKGGEWYLVLTDYDIKTIADYQIQRDGDTTSLDVKNRLREYGFFAEQRRVSDYMQDNYEYTLDSCGAYNRYF